ncbi:MAG TPA: 1-deoxy-D-xylulose-5-phosphate reductoisomerase [Nitrospinota bacterium]|jgi:1-deoxy-D-xylulose-5-phosphate reductoisomerase|nr:1-deoxy-D-xylulose-5-phosphate reductoisomerase [Nitrospinota bacterium]
MPKKIAILGSTGSIGVNTLDIVRNSKNRFKVSGLAAGGNIALLEKQIREFKPKYAALFDEKKTSLLKKRLGRLKVEIFSGIEGLIKVASIPDTKMVVSAIVGAAGLIPTFAALKCGKDIALANKETLVIAGELFMKHSRKKRVRIIPVDSEHSAIFQCINGTTNRKIKKIILTASGGPFLTYPAKQFEKITTRKALNHPNWNMGPKITIDSATLMNKGLEVIEAHWLFGIDENRIDVVIHPESIVHSMVEFIDTSIIAQMGLPDMRVPINYALNYPERVSTNLPTLNLTKTKTLTFSEPDYKKFPCLEYAFHALRIGRTMPAVLNAANEVAVQAFLSGSISFTGIPKIIKKLMRKHQPKKVMKISDIMQADLWARVEAKKLCER